MGLEGKYECIKLAVYWKLLFNKILIVIFWPNEDTLTKKWLALKKLVLILAYSTSTGAETENNQKSLTVTSNIMIFIRSIEKNEFIFEQEFKYIDQGFSYMSSD